MEYLGSVRVDVQQDGPEAAAAGPEPDQGSLQLVAIGIRAASFLQQLDARWPGRSTGM